MYGRRRLSTGARVALGVTAVLAAGVTLLAAIAYTRLSARLDADVERMLLAEAKAFGSAVGTRAADDRRSLLEVSRSYLLSRSPTQGGLEPVLLVRLADGKVIANSDVPVEDAAGNTALRSEGTRQGFQDVRLRGETYRVVTVPVLDSSGGHAAAFQAAVPLSRVRLVARELGWTLALSGLLVTAAGAVLSASVARASLTPLRRIAATADEIRQTSLARRVAYEGPADEVGRMAAALDSMLERLQEAFEEQRRFVADASHELRTPLAVLRGTVDVLAGSTMDEAARAEAVGVIAEEVSRMTRMADDLLALARLDSAERKADQPLDAAVLVDEAVARGSTMDDRDLVTLAPDEDVWVLGEPDLLHRALMNLLRNAIAHTGAGGRIETACTVERAADGSEAVVISVTDDGPGIPERDLDKVFDRFYRVDGSTAEGSGLGLAIVQRTVELHGGSVRAENVAGLGARFVITLPRTPAPEPLAEDAA